MKRLFLAVSIFIIPVLVFADSHIWRSSYTATADTTQNVCGPAGGYSTNRRGYLHGVCISSSAVTGTFTVYNSSASAINPIAVLDTQINGCYYYDVAASTINKGLTYSNTSTGKVTLLYECY